MKPNFAHQNFFTWGEKWIHAFDRVQMNIDDELNILELGTGTGSSAFWIAENLLTHKNSRLTTVDNFHQPHQYRLAKANLSLCANSNKISIVNKNIEAFVSEDLPMYNFIYIDAIHKYEATLYNLFFAQKHLAPGGIILVDDATTADVAKALRFVKTRSEWKLKEFFTGLDQQVGFTNEE